MEAFDYIAIDRDGGRSKGSLSAPSARDARDMLRVRNLTPVELKPARARKTGRDGKVTRTSGRIKMAERVQATRQLAILIGADQPVEESLKLVAMQFEKSPLRAILLDVRTRVMEGTRLSRAMGAHPKAFPDLYTAMVASGEGTGTLGNVFDRLASDLEAAQAVRRKILAATIYPIVLMTVALIIVTILLVFFVPKIVEQFDGFGERLPLLTRIVLGMSEWVQNWGLIAAGMITVGIFLFRRALRRPEVNLRWSKFLLSIPTFGKLTRSLNAARFARTIASLISAGTPPLASMETASHTLTNSTMRAAVQDASVRVREGSSISRALARSDVFPPLVVQMVAGGESSGDIASMFEKSADYLEGEFDAYTSIFLALLEPLIIILLAGFVLLVIAAIFLPILQLQTLVTA